MLRTALFGAGRIGRMHAHHMEAHRRIALTHVYDINKEAARACADTHGARAVSDVDEALGDDVDAVVIATSTDTHVELITRAARAGKAILCEKPIDLDLTRVETCWQDIERFDPKIMIGFNRRFDPTFKKLHDGLRAGEIGDLRQLVITSRDPEIPPLSYMKVAGGLMRDMTIHDFDLARYMLGEEPVRVACFAGALISDEVRRLKDHDTAMILLETASGQQCCINNYRKATYGYDQRVEAIGERGMLKAENRRATSLERWDADFTAAREPVLHFFIERYAEAYVAELDAFVDALERGRPMPVGFEDGRRALMLAEAAYRALTSGTVVTL